MSKRFTDTEKYKKPFIRGLKGPYKLLWDYLYTTCDNAGIWIVDFEVAQIYLGADMKVDREDALRFFNADELRIVEFCGGKKWFIPSFITFQHGKLSTSNPAHNKIIPILRELDFIDESLTLRSTFEAPYKGTKVEVVVDGKVGVGVKKGETEKSKPTNPEVSEIIQELNDLAGRNFEADSKYVSKHVEARLREYPKEDLIDMVRLMVYKWKGDTKMDQYLRPATLFAAENCAKYVQEMKGHRLNGTKPAKEKSKGKTLLDPMQVMREVYQYHESKNQ